MHLNLAPLRWMVPGPGGEELQDEGCCSQAPAGTKSSGHGRDTCGPHRRAGFALLGQRCLNPGHLHGGSLVCVQDKTA